MKPKEVFSLDEKLAVAYVQSHFQVGNVIKHRRKIIITLAQVLDA